MSHCHTRHICCSGFIYNHLCCGSQYSVYKRFHCYCLFGFLITEYRIFPKDSINIILSTVSARIRIIQIAAHAVIIPVKRQRFCLAAQVAVFGEEGRCYHAVVPCPQILALDIRIVGFSVVGVFVLILRSAESDLSGDTVTVGLVDLSLFISSPFARFYRLTIPFLLLYLYPRSPATVLRQNAPNSSKIINKKSTKKAETILKSSLLPA